MVKFLVCRMYLLSNCCVINYHKFSGWKQHTFIILQISWVSRNSMFKLGFQLQGLAWLKSWYGMGCGLIRDLSREVWSPLSSHRLLSGLISSSLYDWYPGFLAVYFGPLSFQKIPAVPCHTAHSIAPLTTWHLTSSKPSMETPSGFRPSLKGFHLVNPDPPRIIAFLINHKPTHLGPYLYLQDPFTMQCDIA